jgi:hypothetical protein
MQMPNYLNQTQERAIITLCANAGMSICKVLEIVCKSSEQIARMNLETHICGVSMMRFFLMRSGKATKTDAVITQIENTYFAIIEVKPRGVLNKMLRFRLEKDFVQNRYLQQRERYFNLFNACMDYKVDDAERFWQRQNNGPGSELFQAILWNIFTSSKELRRPTDAEIVRASHDIHNAVLFIYNFLQNNWEELVLQR